MPAAANREPTVPRRAVSRGVAWAVPTIALATAAPALAASEPCTDADTLTALPAFTAQNWTEQPATGFRGGNRYPVEWLTNYRNEGEPAAHNKADPAAGQAAYATITSVETFCLAPGSYRVRYRTGLLVTNGRSMWLYGEVHEEGGARLRRGTTTTRGRTENGVFGNQGYDFTVDTLTRVRFSFTWALELNAGEPSDATGDDINVYLSTVEKTA